MTNLQALENKPEGVSRITWIVLAHAIAVGLLTIAVAGHNFA